MESSISNNDAIMMSRIASTMEEKIMRMKFIIRGDTGGNMNKRNNDMTNKYMKSRRSSRRSGEFGCRCMNIMSTSDK
jgi:hypothetical protein